MKKSDIIGAAKAPSSHISNLVRTDLAKLSPEKREKILAVADAVPARPIDPDPSAYNAGVKGHG